MRNPMDFTPPEVYKEMDRQAKCQRKMRVTLLFLDMALFALFAVCIMTFVITLISLIKAV